MHKMHLLMKNPYGEGGLYCRGDQLILIGPDEQEHVSSARDTMFWSVVEKFMQEDEENDADPTSPEVA